MNKKNLLGIVALIAFTLPIVIRYSYYYNGSYHGRKIEAPDYEAYKLAPPPTASVPITIDPSLGKNKVVLIDNYHKNMFDPSEIEPFTTLFHERGARVELYDGSQLLANQLKYANAFILFAPTITFTTMEANAIYSFVSSGGRLIVFGDPTRSFSYYDYLGNLYTFPDVNYTNPLLARYGLTMENDYIYNLTKNEGNFRNVMFTDFADDAIVRGLNMIVTYGSHSIKTDTGKLLAIGSKDVYSSLTDHGGNYAPVALSSNGQVLALGDFTFLLDPYNQVADNAALASQIADFALSGVRVKSLDTFPYIFKGNAVTIILAGDAQLNAEMITPIATMQNSLENMDIKSSFKDEAEGDSIVLGVITTMEDFEKYLLPFQITGDPYSGYFEVPGFGKVGKSGNGLILFSPGTSGNKLIAIAGTSSDLITLMGRITSGDLSSCAVQGDIAICSVGYGGSFYDGATPTPYIDTTLMPTPTPYKP